MRKSIGTESNDAVPTDLKTADIRYPKKIHTKFSISIFIINNKKAGLKTLTYC